MQYKRSVYPWNFYPNCPKREKKMPCKKVLNYLYTQCRYIFVNRRSKNKLIYPAKLKPTYRSVEDFVFIEYYCR